MIKMAPTSEKAMVMRVVTPKLDRMGKVAWPERALPTRERLRQCFKAYHAWGVGNPGKVTFLNQFYNSPSIGDDVKKKAPREFQRLEDLHSAAVQEGVLQDLPFGIYLIMVAQVLHGILSLLASGSSDLSPEEIVEHGLGLILKG
jgi:hypothetical protein